VIAIRFDRLSDGARDPIKSSLLVVSRDGNGGLDRRVFVGRRQQHGHGRHGRKRARRCGRYGAAARTGRNTGGVPVNGDQDGDLTYEPIFASSDGLTVPVAVPALTTVVVVFPKRP
jgi:hypothetical protein